MNSLTKKTEKLQKKFKSFYDSKIKLKTRLSALKSYLDNVDISEKRRVCIENYDLIIDIHWKIFETKHERLQALREKSDKPISPSNKEMVDIIKVLRDTVKLIDFCLDGANQKCESFDKLVEASINTTVSYRIKVEGLSLLLLYLNITKTTDEKYINLYKNAVHLEYFGTFPYPEPIDIATRDIDNMSKTILSGKISRTEQSPEKIENEVQLINIILDNILYLLHKQKNYNSALSKKHLITNENNKTCLEENSCNNSALNNKKNEDINNSSINNNKEKENNNKIKNNNFKSATPDKIFNRLPNINLSSNKNDTKINEK